MPHATNRQLHAPEPGQSPHAAPQVEPHLPHDRDESSDSPPEKPTAVGRQAHEDLRRGLVDTDRQPVMEGVYRQQKKR